MTSRSSVQRPANSALLTLAALAVALFWAIEGIDVNDPQVERVAILVGAIVLGWLALRGWSWAPGLTAYLAILVAISERLRREPLLDGSDVLRATTESLVIVSKGGNPYAACLQSTVPPCSPLVYPPGELAWYAIPQWLFGDITRVDTWAGVLIVVALALTGLRTGFEVAALPSMLYASWGIAGYRAIDGSNDVSASALVVFACVALVLARPPDQRPSLRAHDVVFLLSAALFGWAIAFKQFSLLILPPVARWLAVSGARWRRYTLVALGVTAAFCLPFFVRDPLAFFDDQFKALTFHEEIWGTNLLNTMKHFGDPQALLPMFALIEIFGTLALVTFASWRWRPSSLGAAVLAGAGVVMFALLFAKWTTQPYYAYVGGIVAAGLALVSVTAGESRSPSPADPDGSVTTAPGSGPRGRPA